MASKYDPYDLALVIAAEKAGRFLPRARIALTRYEGIIQAAIHDQATAEFNRLLRQAGLEDPVPLSRCRLTARFGRNHKGSPVAPAEDGEEVCA
jgi:hypothetical protein